jgi:hypothetical protein
VRYRILLAVAVAVVVELAKPKALGPDVDDDVAAPDRIVSLRTPLPPPEASDCGDSRYFYSANAALRPEEPSLFGAEPDEETFARRRSVASEPDGPVIAGNLTLVSRRSWQAGPEL